MKGNWRDVAVAIGVSGDAVGQGNDGVNESGAAIEGGRGGDAVDETGAVVIRRRNARGAGGSVCEVGRTSARFFLFLFPLFASGRGSGWRRLGG